MRTLFTSLGLTAVFVATPAFAQDPAAPPPPIVINATAAIVSDYRFRGVSQTDRNFGVQGSITVTHQSGLYASVYGYSVDGYVTAAADPAGSGCCTANAELDLIVGFKKTYGGTTFDIGALYYYYPKSKARLDRTSSDFVEPYLAISHTFGPLTAKGTVNWAPRQKALALNQIGPSKSNVYLAGDLSASIPNTPIGLTAHLGHNFGPSWLATDATGKKGYTDWALGATVTYKVLTLGIAYVDTDARFISTSGKNVSKGGIVGSMTASF